MDWLHEPRAAHPGCLGSSCGKRGSFCTMDKLLSSSHLLGCRQPRMSSRTQASRTKGPSVDEHCKQSRQTDQQTDRQHRQAGGAPKTSGPSPVPLLSQASSHLLLHSSSCPADPALSPWVACRHGSAWSPLRGSLQCCLAVCFPCCAHAHCQQRVLSTRLQACHSYAGCSVTHSREVSPVPRERSANMQGVAWVWLDGSQGNGTTQRLRLRHRVGSLSSDCTSRQTASRLHFTGEDPRPPGISLLTCPHA